jgi:hypothetical protein
MSFLTVGGARMTSTPEPMIAQLRQEFETLLTVVTGPATRTHTADAVERLLFRRVLALGGGLLRLFFETRAAVRPSGPVTGRDGTPLTYHDRRPTTYFSVFGKLAFRRHAFTAPGQPVVCPLDADLSLPGRCYSDLLREWTAYASTDAAYRETQAVLERILGLSLSTQAVETITQEDAADVAAFSAQPPDPATPVAGGTILVAQADGKGVPVVLPPATERPVRRSKGQPANRKREAIVTALYTIAPYPRTPEDVVAALLHETDPAGSVTRPRPIRKEVRATLDGKEAALGRLAARAAQRTHAAIQHRVALTDGAAALQQQMTTQLPGFTLVLDIIHVTEYLWDAANAVLGERHPGRTAWVRRHLERILAGQTTAVIAALTNAAAHRRLSATRRQAVERTVGYYQRNLPFMRYDEYLARGWPIGTGVVEGACGHLVKDRLEQAGMRWTQAGAQAVLDLRGVRLSGDWDAYWPWHRQQAHVRLYGTTSSVPPPIEDQALEEAA